MSDFRLKVFQSVAKNLSFTKASQELFVSQPAITKHIQELEACYQARLFDRQEIKYLSQKPENCYWNIVNVFLMLTNVWNMKCIFCTAIISVS